MAKTMAQALRAEIIERGITQATASRLLGISPALLSRWMTLDAQPQPPNFDALCEFLGVDLEGLGLLILASATARWQRGQ